MWCHKFPSKHFFGCIPQILICFVFITFQFLYFPISLWCLLWHMGYLEMSFYISSYPWIFSRNLSANDFQFNSLGIRELCQMISIFLNLLSIFSWHNIWSILIHFPYACEKNVAHSVHFVVVVSSVLIWQLEKLVDSIFWVFYILHWFSVIVPPITEK